jgi:hypothetical protein
MVGAKSAEEKHNTDLGIFGKEVNAQALILGCKTNGFINVLLQIKQPKFIDLSFGCSFN